VARRGMINKVGLKGAQLVPGEGNRDDLEG